MAFLDQLKHAWNAFRSRDPTDSTYYGSASYARPDRMRYSGGNEKSIVTSIYNRIALDVSSLKFSHVQLDEAGRFSSTRKSGLQNCLTIEANVDQTGRELLHDIAASCIDEGVIAVVPTDTRESPITGAFEIEELRVGKIVDWYPKHVRVELYNEATGQKEQVLLPKRMVAIIQNPFYSVINERNSTMQRLVRKLALMDAVDERINSGRLDLIIQVPYSTRSDLRKTQAEDRRKVIEDQLVNSKYGIAYTEATEHIVQLNRPLENSLTKQVEYLTSMLYSQLGITQAIMDGTADEKTMLNYNNRTIEPFAAAICDEFNRKFLTKTARSQGQAVKYFTDPFRLVPINNIAEIADKFTRNEIMTSNEIRQVIGLMPSSDPAADELRNKNLSKSNAEEEQEQDGVNLEAMAAQLDEGESQNG